MRNAIITIAAGLMLMSVTSGCASWTTSKPKNNNSMWSRMQFWKKPYQRPQKMAAIWTHDILTMTAKPPTRGFGGRIYFYNEKSQAIPVDGELIVHGYEEVPGQTLDAGKTKADKTFMFTAEQFTSHFSSSELGASYSVWIPWDAAEGMQKEITLIPAFKGTDGSLVQGDPAKLILPGRTKEEPNRNSPFQQVSFQQSETPTADGPLPVLGGMKTTTISRPTQINRLAKKSNRASETNSSSTTGSQLNNALTTEVHYGNGPVASSSQPTSNSYSLYSNQPHSNQPQMPANGPQAASMPLQGNLPNSYSMSAAQTQVNYPQGNFSQPNYPGITPATLPNAQVPYSQVANGQYPNTQNSQFSNAQLPNGQMPNALMNHGQQPNIPYGAPSFQNNSVKPNAIGSPQPSNVPTGGAVPNQLSPGFAEFNPVQPAAVASAFATQWQPFGQPPIPLIQQQPQSYNQVQPAGYQQSFTGGVPGAGITTGAQVPGQPQVTLPGQLNRY